jgi:hypothetical protein
MSDNRRDPEQPRLHGESHDEGETVDRFEIGPDQGDSFVKAVAVGLAAVFDSS